MRLCISPIPPRSNQQRLQVATRSKLPVQELHTDWRERRSSPRLNRALGVQ